MLYKELIGDNKQDDLVEVRAGLFACCSIAFMQDPALMCDPGAPFALCGMQPTLLRAKLSADADAADVWLDPHAAPCELHQAARGAVWHHLCTTQVGKADVRC